MSEMTLHSGVSDYRRARREIANPGDFAESLATTALEAVNHLFETDGNTIRIGDKWYGLLVNNEKTPIMVDYNKKLGVSLRDARNDSGFSLNRVEEMTDGEFKASVVGAYERGERAITAVRLQGLCQVYGVRPSDILPYSREDL